MIDANLPPISSDDLFTDEQMREFLTNGFVIIKPDLPKSIHDTCLLYTSPSPRD